MERVHELSGLTSGGRRWDAALCGGQAAPVTVAGRSCVAAWTVTIPGERVFGGGPADTGQDRPAGHAARVSHGVGDSLSALHVFAMGIGG